MPVKSPLQTRGINLSIVVQHWLIKWLISNRKYPFSQWLVYQARSHQHCKARKETIQAKKGNHVPTTLKSQYPNLPDARLVLGGLPFSLARHGLRTTLKKLEVPSLPEEMEYFMAVWTPCPPEVLITECCVFPVLLWYWILDCQLNSFDKKYHLPTSLFTWPHNGPPWEPAPYAKLGFLLKIAKGVGSMFLPWMIIEFSLSSNANIPVQREQKVMTCVWIYSSLTDDWCCDQYRYMGKSGSLSASKKELQVRKSIFHIDTPKVPSSNFMKHAYQPLTPSNTSTVLIHYIGDEK